MPGFLDINDRRSSVRERQNIFSGEKNFVMRDKF